ncbi:ATP-dependent RNA helicase DeaD [Proteiniborus ethanoligenes]|uniref:ATP-dependent RNA helicase CshA n=1 Tax=Proteiniborus ethanoligenes TaxID=415015 RepID=A0A1H3R9R0_9FIRM|nr:DEAD/DEAH box helicase [Proteiniborus ethanoligenes]TAH63810.1 MAG: DEAD/DEAH box helicase [Gottschalkiaceae bacterium]SDZ22504.1 ATP-dependent RNA helicase DeaD [Proteiniborus ethanoligenes]
MKNLVFGELNLSKEIEKAVSEMGFEEATPIQSQSIPHIMDGKDVIGQAQTGTGKTCAFGIPTIEMVEPSNENIQALILSPTRELAIQISEELKEVSKYKKGIRILPVYGGQPIERQIAALKKRPQIIIGTPGRLMDHMRRRTIKLVDLKMVILDEADEMLNMGFREDIDEILEKVPQERQTILFSATMSKEIMDLTAKYQKDAVLVKAVHKELTVPNIEQYYLEVREASKLDLLSRIIDKEGIKLSLVFCNTKKRVDELTSSLQSRGYMAEALHGDMKQSQRDRVMSRFRNGSIEILVATDVAARGIDVDNVEAVFNYDIPNDEEYYVHRIGRTGRAGKTGVAYTFVAGREFYRLKDIQRYTKSKIVLMKPPSLSDIEESKVNNVLKDLKNVIAKNNLGKYVGYIDKILEDVHLENQENYITTIDIAAALLKTLVTQNSKNDFSQADTYNYEDTGAEKGMVRLFVNMGRKDRIQPKHIVEAIASRTSLSGKLIGAIDIFDKFSFVDIPYEYVDEVLSPSKNFRIKGKKLTVEKANRK